MLGGVSTKLAGSSPASPITFWMMPFTVSFWNTRQLALRESCQNPGTASSA